VSETPVIGKMRDLVNPIASDLELDLYDVEQRGGTIRVTLDTEPGADDGVSLEKLALATRLISRELDHQDPIPGKYTLEVTSPGVERNLRTAAHFQRELGKVVNIRLANTDAIERRFEGTLVDADETTATIRVIDEPTGLVDDRAVEIASIDRARTVFVWGPKPKPGGPKKSGGPSKKVASKKVASKNVASKPGGPSNKGTGKGSPSSGSVITKEQS
jgi:ribosome maturation factor RimP